MAGHQTSGARGTRLLVPVIWTNSIVLGFGHNYIVNRVFSTEHTIAWYPGQKTLDALPFILQFNFYEGRCVKFFDKCQFVSNK